MVGDRWPGPTLKSFFLRRASSFAFRLCFLFRFVHKNVSRRYEKICRFLVCEQDHKVEEIRTQNATAGHLPIEDCLISQLNKTNLGLLLTPKVFLQLVPVVDLQPSTFSCRCRKPVKYRLLTASFCIYPCHQLHRLRHFTFPNSLSNAHPHTPRQANYTGLVIKRRRNLWFSKQIPSRSKPFKHFHSV